MQILLFFFFHYVIVGLFLLHSVVLASISHVSQGHDDDRASRLEGANYHQKRVLLHDEKQEKRAQSSKNAYVSVLYDGDNSIGVRTLGASIKSSSTTADMVVLVTSGVDQATRKQLQRDGWRVKVVDAILNPNGRYGSYVYTKIWAWALTDYERLVVLEPDMLILANVDELFDCGSLCAVMQQSELINPALLVIKPDQQVFESLKAAVPFTYSFDGKEGGFLNSYFDDFAACSMFDPTTAAVTSADVKGGSKAQKALNRIEPVSQGSSLVPNNCYRLPTRYVGDLLLIMLNGGLGMVRSQNVMPAEWWEARYSKMVSFNLAGLRPWQWYSAPFLPYAEMWEEYSHVITAAGEDEERSSTIFMYMIRWLFPWLISAIGLYILFRTKTGVYLTKTIHDWLAWGLELGPWRLAKAVLSIVKTQLTRLMLCCRGGGQGRRRRGGGGRGSSASPGGAILDGAGSGGGGNGGGCSGSGGIDSLSSIDPRGGIFSMLHLKVAWISIFFGINMGVVLIPAYATPRLAWLILLSWTCAVPPLLWMVYLRVLFLCGMRSIDKMPYQQRQELLASYCNGGSIAGNGIYPTAASAAGQFGQQNFTEGVGAYVLFTVLQCGIPLWKKVSGASSLLSILVPIGAMVVGLILSFAVIAFRMPPLWYDYGGLVALEESRVMGMVGAAGSGGGGVSGGGGNSKSVGRGTTDLGSAGGNSGAGSRNGKSGGKANDSYLHGSAFLMNGLKREHAG